MTRVAFKLFAISDYNMFKLITVSFYKLKSSAIDEFMRRSHSFSVAMEEKAAAAAAAGVFEIRRRQSNLPQCEKRR